MSQQLSEYFAATSPEVLTGQLNQKVKEFYDHLNNTKRMELWARSYKYYNNGLIKDGRLNRVGNQGEFTEVSVNHLRNLMLHVLNMTCGQKPSFEPRSTNSDYKSMAQTIVANGFLEYYSRLPESGLIAVLKKAVEHSLIYGDGYVYQGWDFSRGDPYMPDMTGKMVKTGDVVNKNYAPYDVIFDFVAAQLGADRQWYVLRDFQNKWDLVARFPEMKETILAKGKNPDLYSESMVTKNWKVETDMVPVYIFIHNRTEALPQGRFFVYVDEGCWLIDSALPEFYKTVPVNRIYGIEQDACGFGYSPAFDLLPLQELYNGLCSIVATNQSTFGVQNILVPTGSNIGLTELTDGLNAITYDPKFGEPKALNLTSTPVEIFNFIDKIERTMETISGVNSTARGNPEASLKSGSALALVQSMAIQFNSGLQQSYAQLMESLGTGLIKILQKNAKVPKMIEIAGKNNRSYMKEFTGKDLETVDRVTVDFGNPLSRTTAGKLQIAENLLGANMIENPQQYIQVLSTGKLEPLIEGKQAELMLIRNENESLMEGKPVTAIMTDVHSIHIQEHKCVLSSVDSRNDPNAVMNTLNHINEHLNLWRTADPGLLQMIGEIAPPPPPMPAPMDGTVPEMANPENTVTQEAEKVNLPNMPTDPLTGQSAALNIVQ